jgi:hypothetical protein
MVENKIMFAIPLLQLHSPPDYEGFWWYSIPFLLLIINRIED